MARIAFYDFDGTITNKDTLIEFIKFSKGKVEFYKGLVMLSPALIAMKLGVLSSSKAKEKMFTYFFGGDSFTWFERQCTSFADEIIPRILRPKALENIQQQQAQGIKVVVVTASPENWVSKWTTPMGIECIGTKLLVTNQVVTGCFDGENCVGEEKVNRINARFNIGDFSEVYAYGDSKKDKPMLRLANFSFYKPFQT